MNILIVGASGFIGKNLVPQMAENQRVSILVRETSNIELFKSNQNISILYGDLDKNQGIIEALDGIDAVIHCAARTMGRSYWDFYRTNTAGTVHLLNAMHVKNVRKILYLSSHAACGPSNSNEPRTQHKHANPISFYGRTKRLAEHSIMNSGLRFTIIRSVSVYGPYDKEILTYVKLLNRGICPIVGFGEKYLNLIYVKDLVNLVIRVIETDHFMDEVYFANDGRCYSLDSVMDTIARTLNKKSIRIHVPTSLALFIGLLNDVFLSPDRKLVTRDKIRELACQYWTCSSADANLELGFTPRYTFEQGIAETVRWYRDQGHFA